MKIYCVHEKKFVDVPKEDLKVVPTKNGRHMIKTKCPSCEKNISQFCKKVLE